MQTKKRKEKKGHHQATTQLKVYGESLTSSPIYHLHMKAHQLHTEGTFGEFTSILSVRIANLLIYSLVYVATVVRLLFLLQFLPFTS